jgi:hypothetical protein
LPHRRLQRFFRLFLAYANYIAGAARAPAQNLRLVAYDAGRLVPATINA